MSAASDPVPEYDDPLAQVAADVDALRRRLDDQQVSLRRNHQAMTALAESVGKMVERYRQHDKKASFNSFVAYILFTVLLGGGAALLYRSRAAELERGRNEVTTDLEATRKALADAQKQLHDRDQASARAYEVYQQLASGKRGEVDGALGAYEQVAKLPLSPIERDVLAEGAKGARAAELDANVEAGAELVKKGDLARAQAELRKAIGLGATSAAAHYWLGVALVRASGKDQDTAAAESELRAALNAKIDQADARYWLGVALEANGKRAEARKQYETYAAANPMAPYAAQARARWLALGQPAAAAP